MNKLSVVVSAPVDTYSGYGARSRDFIKALINSKPEWDIKILSQRWGNTKFGYLQDHNEDELAKRIIIKLESKPKIWFQITVPNEFQAVGDYNIGVTAGIETTICDAKWIQGMNNMNLILTSSNHSKKVLEETSYNGIDNRTGKKTILKCKVPIEVVFEGVDLNLYKKPENSQSVEIVESLNEIKESFCFLFVGHWLQGDHTQDRKNIGGMVECFFESFRNKLTKPALILKTQSASSSIIDQYNISENIRFIRKKLGKGNLPNIYLLHGEINDKEINHLYNHPKVKAMVNFTRGEGFGRPLLEFTTTGKPIIASGWSGHTDFLRSDLNVLVGGKLEQIHPSAVQKEMLLADSKWFTFNFNEGKKAFKEVYKNYKRYINLSRKQRTLTTKNFSFNKMQELITDLVHKYVPFFPIENNFVAPLPDKIELPKIN